MGVSAELLEIDCRLDLSLFKTRLALLMNLVNPLGLSSEPPAPPCPEELMVRCCVCNQCPMYVYISQQLTTVSDNSSSDEHYGNGLL